MNTVFVGAKMAQTLTQTPSVAKTSPLLVSDSYPPNSPWYIDNIPLYISDMGKSVTVTVTDRCTGCDMYDLDFSPGAFGYLSSLSAGRLYGMTWTWA